MNNKSNEEKQTKRAPRKTNKKRVCQFCVDKIDEVDYKDVNKLKKYLQENGKIAPHRATGVCAKHQRSLTIAIKRARCMALIPFKGNIRGDN